MSEPKLIGRWTLESFENLASDGTKTIVTQGQSGVLEYSPDGKMAVIIRRDPDLLLRLGVKISLEDIEYSGTFSFDENTHTIIHHVSSSKILQFVGKDLKRQCELTSERLTLSGIGKDGLAKLIWRKLSQCGVSVAQAKIGS